MGVLPSEPTLWAYACYSQRKVGVRYGYSVELEWNLTGAHFLSLDISSSGLVRELAVPENQHVP